LVIAEMNKRLPVLVLVVCAGAFAFGLFQLFKLRFDVGDVYPPYSSLRSDPLGTMALCESLERMPGLSVERDFSSANRLPEDKDTTYLHLAAEPEDWLWLPDELVGEIEQFVNRGGRLAITFFPQTSRILNPLFYGGNTSTNPPPTKAKSAAGKRSTASQPKTKKSQDEPESSAGVTSLRKRWGIGFGFLALPRSETDSYEPVHVENKTALPLPAILDWHSALVLTNLDKSWQTIYARGVNPVVVERKFGSGTIVMATDSYFLSNEAMRKDRHADLLSWLAGSSRHIVFDEGHLGIVETPGVALLMRKYRLYWLVGGLLLLAGLFIWKNSLSFVPPAPDEVQPDYVAGQEAAAGFVNLLRRNIAPKDVLRTCFDEWSRSLAQGARHSITRVDQAQAILEAEYARPPRERNPIRAYQEICKALKGKT
jgi:hypothetical protein